ncbi:MAG: hypothetical protein PHS82_06295 [Lachnospiraceae bacterium]|nr:hypothetical protein [Lachnospiraceae bacterium]
MKSLIIDCFAGGGGASVGIEMALGMNGQINIFEYEKEISGSAMLCKPYICNRCLYWWSSRCPYGKCYDDHRSKISPYDKAHPDRPPRTAWSNWKTDQAYWCRGGIFHPTIHCEHFIKYSGQQVKECLKANVSVFQDGYIGCSLVEKFGCEKCYEEWEEKDD